MVRIQLFVTHERRVPFELSPLYCAASEDVEACVAAAMGSGGRDLLDLLEAWGMFS